MDQAAAGTIFPLECETLESAASGKWGIGADLAAFLCQIISDNGDVVCFKNFQKFFRFTGDAGENDFFAGKLIVRQRFESLIDLFYDSGVLGFFERMRSSLLHDGQ